MSCVDTLLLHKCTLEMKEEKTSGGLPLQNTQEVNVILQLNQWHHQTTKITTITTFKRQNQNSSSFIFFLVSLQVFLLVFKPHSSFLSFSGLLISLLLFLDESAYRYWGHGFMSPQNCPSCPVQSTWKIYNNSNDWFSLRSRRLITMETSWWRQINMGFVFQSDCEYLNYCVNEKVSHTHNTSDIPQKQISSLHLVNE